MVNVWCVRADFGTYTKQFVKGGYIAIDYSIARDLGSYYARRTIHNLSYLSPR